MLITFSYNLQYIVQLRMVSLWTRESSNNTIEFGWVIIQLYKLN
jgi:hypothetical protein